MKKHYDEVLIELNFLSEDDVITESAGETGIDVQDENLNWYDLGGNFQ